jgi:hypothetical protein
MIASSVVDGSSEAIEGNSCPFVLMRTDFNHPTGRALDYSNSVGGLSAWISSASSSHCAL